MIGSNVEDRLSVCLCGAEILHLVGRKGGKIIDMRIFGRASDDCVQSLQGGIRLAVCDQRLS
jgi:hypothetical protein